jgi:hypothetical protein
MADPPMSNASSAPAASSTEGPPVLGNSWPWGIVSRITPSLGEVVSPAVVAAPMVSPVVHVVVLAQSSTLMVQSTSAVMICM